MTNTIENIVMDQARNAGEVMGKLSFLIVKLRGIETPKNNQYQKERLKEAIQMAEECYETLRK